MEAVEDIEVQGRAARFKSFAWIGMGIILIAYGFMAFNAGTKVSPLLNDSDSAAASAEAVTRIIEQSDQGVSMHAEASTQEALPFWIRLIAQIESSEYALGSDSLMETERHYHSMPETKRSVLSTHMMLGLVLMTTGFFQFLPAFRRKYRKAHRVLGVVYVLTAVTSMSMSSYYLLNTAVADVYSQFIFFAGLWLLVGISMFSIAMAIWSILRRDIAAHLGWQALAFGCFLTAPIQRILWIGLSPLSNGVTFNEVNILVNVILLPVAFLAGFALFCVNRASSPVRNAIDVPPLSGLGRNALIVAAVLSVALTAVFLGGAGLSGSQVTQGVAMAEAARAHDAVVMGAGAYVAVLLTVVSLWFGVRLLLVAQSALPGRRPELFGMVMTASLCACLYLYWSLGLGMPSHEQSLAGVGYGLTGVLLLVFAGITLRQFLRGDIGKCHEALWFLVLLCMAPGLMYAMLFVVDASSIVPAPFDQQGHGYQLAAGAALIIPVLVSQIRSMYSAETRRYAIN